MIQYLLDAKEFQLTIFTRLCASTDCRMLPSTPNFHSCPLFEKNISLVQCNIVVTVNFLFYRKLSF